MVHYLSSSDFSCCLYAIALYLTQTNSISSCQCLYKVVLVSLLSQKFVWPPFLSCFFL